MKNRGIAIAMLTIFLNGVSVFSAANIVANPSFEIAVAGDESTPEGWHASVGGVEGTQSARTSETSSDGEWSHLLSTRGNLTNGGSSQLVQDSSDLPSLLPGQEIVLEFDVRYFETQNVTGAAFFSIVGAGVGIVADTDIDFPVSGDFLRVQTAPLVVPDLGSFPLADSYFYQLEFIVSSSPSSIHYAEAYIDNVVVDAILVPEPSTVPLALFGLILLLRGSRQRQLAQAK